MPSITAAAVGAIVCSVVAAGCSPIPPRGDRADAPTAAGPVPADGDLFAYRPEARRLDIGDQVPDFEFLDLEASKRSLAGFRDRVVVLSFLTAGEDPETDGATIERLAQVAAEIGPTLAEEVEVLVMLIDDSDAAGAHLATVAATVPDTVGPPRWTFGRASAQTTALWTAAFGVVIWKNGDGSIGHTLGAAVIGPDGSYADQFPGLASWAPIDVAAAAGIAAGR